MVETRETGKELTTLLEKYTANEVEFLRRYPHLPIERQEYYIKENLLGFLGEFIGEVPYKRITYELKEDGAYYAGIRVRDSYERAVEREGYGSRTWYETEGFKNAEDALLAIQDDETSLVAATILSPPKVADYGFAFHFEKGGYDNELKSDVLYAYILEYPEIRGALDNTHAVARQLVGYEKAEETFQRAEDYLTTPFLHDENQSRNPLTRLLTTLHIDEQKIAYSKRFLDEITNQLGSWIHDYFSGIYLVAQSDELSMQQQISSLDLQSLLTAMYNKAGIIKKQIEGVRIDEPMVRYFEQHRILTEFDQHTRVQEQSYYAAIPPITPVRKSDCPPLSGGVSSGYVSSLDIAVGLSGGASMGQIMSNEQTIQSREPFRCPQCQFVSYESVGDQCPKSRGGCGLTKEEYIKEAKKKGVKVC